MSQDPWKSIERSSLIIKAVLRVSAETFGTEMISGMFQLMAQRRIGRVCVDRFREVKYQSNQTNTLLSEIDYYQTIGNLEETGAVFGLGLKMRALGTLLMDWHCGTTPWSEDLVDLSIY